jgi:hypothetical protein
LAQTRYIPINYPATQEEQLFYITDDRDLSADEKFVLATLIANYCGCDRAMTVAELCEASGWPSEKVLAPIHGLLFRKKIQMIPSGKST